MFVKIRIYCILQPSVVRYLPESSLLCNKITFMQNKQKKRIKPKIRARTFTVIGETHRLKFCSLYPPVWNMATGSRFLHRTENKSLHI